MRVLVVDDDEVALIGLCDLLGMDGFAACPCRSASEASILLRSDPFDAVVANLELSGSGGLAVVRAAARSRPEARVVVVTASVGSSEARAALAQGAGRIFAKPLRYEMLAEELRRTVAD